MDDFSCMSVVDRVGNRGEPCRQLQRRYAAFRQGLLQGLSVNIFHDNVRSFVILLPRIVDRYNRCMGQLRRHTSFFDVFDRIEFAVRSWNLNCHRSL